MTPYKLGAFGANHALRQSLVYLDMPVMQQPELYVGGIAEMFGPSSALESDEGRKLLRTFMEKLADFAAAASRGAAARSFEAFLKRRGAAAAAYVDGDATPLSQILAREDPATFLSPRGDTVQGAEAVATRYQRDATSFERGGNNRMEILQSAAAGDVAWWTGYQIAESRLVGKPGAVPMKLRVTEAFRFRQSGWKLVHRHAEPAKPADK